MIYVDPLMDHGWRLGQSCHMFADTVVELRIMAVRIGMKLKWEQPPTDRRAWPHYDLTVARRARAIRLGVIPLDRAATVKKWNSMRTRKGEQ